MINHIKGRIEDVNPAYVIVETAGGVGYCINISLATFSEIKDLKEVRLLTYFIVKEDAQVLYGFATEEERNIEVRHMGEIAGLIDMNMHIKERALGIDHRNGLVVVVKPVGIELIHSLDAGRENKVIMEEPIIEAQHSGHTR